MNRLRSIAPASAFIAFGHLLFIGLLVLGVQHWQLRTIHVDSACQIFKWINNEGLQIEAHRYTAIFPQLLVKLFASGGVSLATLLLVASVAHVLVPWLIYILIAHVLKRPWYALGGALAAVLCTRLTFYGIVLEVNYLLCYPFLLAAALDAVAVAPHMRWPKVLALAALAFVLLVHPVGFLLALFVFALFLLRDGGRAHVFALSGIAVLWGVLGRTVLPPTGYEQSLYDGIAAGWTSLPQGTRQPALDFFFGHTWRYTMHYMGWWLLAATLVGLLVRRKAWGAVLIVVGSVLGFILLTVLTYHQGETAMMMEKNFLPLATMVTLPLLPEVERMGQRAQWLAFVAFTVVVFVQFRGISFASRPVGERFAVLQRVVDEARSVGSGTVSMDAAALDARGLHIHWALAYETLLLSGIDGPAKCVIVQSMDQGEALGHSIDTASLDPQWFQPPVGTEHVLSAQHDH